MNPQNKALLGFISAALLSGVALWEGTRYKAYYDVAGIPTVCTGNTKNVVFGKTYSQQECHNLLKQDLKEHAQGVVQCIDKPMEQNQFDAFVMMAYNVGVKGFCGSRAAKLFNQGLPKEACKAMAYGPNNEPVWSYADGEYVQGLHNRRIYEMKMCLGELSVK